MTTEQNRVIFEYNTVDTWNKCLIYKLLKTISLLNISHSLSGSSLFIVATLVICHLFATPSLLTLTLSMMQLLKTFHLFSSRRFQGPSWTEKTRKDKNYLVWLSTRGGEEWNDEEGQRGHRKRDKDGGEKEEEEEVEKSNQEAWRPWNEQIFIEEKRVSGVKEEVVWESGSFVELNLWSGVKHDIKSLESTAWKPHRSLFPGQRKPLQRADTLSY